MFSLYYHILKTNFHILKTYFLGAAAEVTSKIYYCDHTTIYAVVIDRS